MSRFEFVRLVAVGAVVLVTACSRTERAPASFPMAGVSARTKFWVRPLRAEDLGTDAEGEVYHRFVHRCSGCHVTPSPSQHPAGSWPSIVHRMARHAGAAGLLPIENEEADAIAALLQRHAPRDVEAASQNQD